MEECGGTNFSDAGRQIDGGESRAGPERILIDFLHPFGNIHRTKVCTFPESAVADGLHAGGYGHGNDGRSAESAVANSRHAGGNLRAEDPAVPESAGTDAGNALPDNDFPDLAAVSAPRLFFDTAEIRYGPAAGDGQRPSLCQSPGEPCGKRSVGDDVVGGGIVRCHIAFRIPGDVMVGVAHHLVLGYCPSPMD